MRYYAGFSQIGSHMSFKKYVASTCNIPLVTFYGNYKTNGDKPHEKIEGHVTISNHFDNQM